MRVTAAGFQAMANRHDDLPVLRHPRPAGGDARRRTAPRRPLPTHGLARPRRLLLPRGRRGLFLCPAARAPPGASVGSPRPSRDTGALRARICARSSSGTTGYYGVPLNGPALNAFRAAMVQLWWRVLRRRSQGNHLTWRRMGAYADRWLPTLRICHPDPRVRFAVTTQGKSRMR